MYNQLNYQWRQYFEDLLSYITTNDNINYQQILYDIINYISNNNLIINEQNRLDFKNHLYQIINKLKSHIDIKIDNLFDITNKSNNTIKNMGSFLDVIGQIYNIDMLSHLNKIVNGLLTQGSPQGLKQGFNNEDINKYKLLKNSLNKSYINNIQTLPKDIKKYLNKYSTYDIYNWIAIDKLTKEELYKNPNALEIIKKDIKENPNNIANIIANIALNPNEQILQIVEDYLKDNRMRNRELFDNLLNNKNQKNIDILYNYANSYFILHLINFNLLLNPNLYNYKNINEILFLIDRYGSTIGNYRKTLLGLSSNPNGFISFEYVLQHFEALNRGWDLHEDIFDEIISFDDIYENNIINININILKNPDVRFFKYFDYPKNLDITNYDNIIDEIIDEIFTIGYNNIINYNYLFALFETDNQNILNKIDQYIEKEINTDFSLVRTDYRVLLKNPYASYLIIKYQDYFIDISPYFYENIALNTNTTILNLINLQQLLDLLEEDLLNENLYSYSIKIGVLENLALNSNPKAFEIITDNWYKIISLDENMLRTFWKNLSSNPNIYYLHIVK